MRENFQNLKMNLSKFCSKSVIKSIGSCAAVNQLRLLSSKSLKLEPNVEQIDDNNGKVTTQNEQRITVIAHPLVIFSLSINFFRAEATSFAADRLFRPIPLVPANIAD